MAPTPTGKGYWLVASDGGIFAFGDAAFFGSTGGIHAEQADRRHGADADRRRLLAGRRPTAASSPSATPAFFGSTGAIKLNQPIVGMAPTPTRHAATGSWPPTAAIFAFGDAALPRLDRRHQAEQPIVGMAAT